jgi:hypothetical protein
MDKSEMGIRSYSDIFKFPSLDSESPPKWVWIKVEPSQMEEVTQLSPDTHLRFIHIRSYSDIFKISSSDSESPQKMGLGTS